LSITRINPVELHPPVDNLYTHIVRVQAPVHYRIGGQVAIDATGALEATDMAGQIASVYRQVDATLKSLGLRWDNVVHLTTYTTDMDAYMAAEKAIAAPYFQSYPPASTLVEVNRLVERNWLVEVQVDAASDT